MRRTTPQVRHIELPDVYASEIAVDTTGQFIALAGSRELTVFAFDRSTQLHTFPLNSRSDPKGLAWQPNDPSKLAVVRHTRCELLTWDVKELRLSVCHVLGGYIRPITSFDWSSCHPHLLITASSDQFRAICIWDVRDLSRPARAIESLSAPSVIKWNRVAQEKFACSHRNELRLWDMRTNMPEQYLTEASGSSVTSFDWHPKVEREVCVAHRDGQLHVWRSCATEAPKVSVQLPAGSIRKVSFSPSGGHIITLPEPTNWSQFGLGTWDSVGLQKSGRRLWTVDSGRNHTVKPKPTDSILQAFDWRNVSNFVTGRSFDQDDCFSPDGDELYGTEIPNYESPLQLVTWSVDHHIRLYPIHWARDCTSLGASSSTVTTTTGTVTKHDRQGSIVTDLLDTSLFVPGVSGAPNIVTHNEASTIALSSSTATTAASPSALPSPSEPRSHTIRRLHSSNASSTKHKHGDQLSASNHGEEPHSRLSLPKWTSVGPVLKTTVHESRDHVSSLDDNAYQVLAQELSLLSPRAGQYKLQETDLINRTVKLVLYYCRHKHFHHYTVCTAAAGGDGVRRNSSELDGNGDLESLLLPADDLLPTMETPGRVDAWQQVGRCKSSEELDTFSGDETGRHSTSRSSMSCSQLTAPDQSSKPMQSSSLGEKTASSASLIVQNESLDDRGMVELRMPLSGTVTLSVDFPLTYPTSVPMFTVVDHEPPLPNEVIVQLNQVLKNTARELTHTSRGCMEPCVRKAVDFLQNVTSLRLSTLNNQFTEESVDGIQSSRIDTCSSQPFELTQQNGSSANSRLGNNLSIKDENASRCPFPRLCGTRFAPNGYLVTFGLSCGPWITIAAGTLNQPGDDSTNKTGRLLPVTTSGSHTNGFLPRTYHEFRQSKMRLRSGARQHFSGTNENWDKLTDEAMKPRKDSLPNEFCDTDGAERGSGELQLKEMIHDLVLGSCEADRVSNQVFSSPVAKPTAPFKTTQRRHMIKLEQDCNKSRASVGQLIVPTPDPVMFSTHAPLKVKMENPAIAHCKFSRWLSRHYRFSQPVCVHGLPPFCFP